MCRCIDASWEPCHLGFVLNLQLTKHREPCRQRDFQLEHRTDVDLKDKWRNITKAIGQNKKMRGFNMAADLVLRVQNCMRVAAVGFVNISGHSIQGLA
jgi:superfamily II DNA helicase RecQ